jgi:hypothetical protein
VTSGQVHDSQVVEGTLNTPRPPLAVTADKANDSEKVSQRIRDDRRSTGDPEPQPCPQEGLLPQIRLPTATQNRELLLPHQRLAAHRHPLRLARDFLAATTLIGVLDWIKL